MGDISKLNVGGTLYDIKDAKARTDVSDLKEDIGYINDGQIVLSKADSLRRLTKISENILYSLDGVVIGTTALSNINTYGGYGSYALKVPLKNASSITYPLFTSSSNLGSFIFDDNDIVLWKYTEPTLSTGTLKTVSVPDSASYMLVSITSSLAALSWSITVDGKTIPYILNAIDDINDDIELLLDKTISKTDALANYQKYHENEIYQVSSVVIGTTTESTVSRYESYGSYALKIPLKNVKSISYPVFKTSSYGGSIICDANDVVIYAYAETEINTGSNRLINIPEGASYMMLQISTSLAAMAWDIVLYGTRQIYNSSNNSNDTETPFTDENRNMCLAGIKTDILTNKIPYHRGYLFHKLQNNDNSLWYGNSFDKINKIGDVSFNPTYMRFAVSPKDGRIIAVQRDVRSGIYVWDGTTETHVTGFTSEPMAWLYNSGVDFINDSSNVEHCIFAEYTQAPSADITLNVWRGTYPYTAKSDWGIVLSQTSGDVDIGHFHMIRRDPWTDILYCTSGDGDAQSKWWYSTDYGETWSLLVSGSTTGWSGQVCRTINFIFTSEYIYWATDHAENTHALYRIQRDSGTGVIDLSTREKITDLPSLYATNSLCYVESPNGLFMYDRIDTTSTSIFGDDITMKFWNFETETLEDVAVLGLTSNTWGGSRGKCYINYTNSKQPMPAMGFSIDTPCIFDLVCDNPSNIGTIAYDVGSKTIRTIDY